MSYTQNLSDTATDLLNAESATPLATAKSLGSSPKIYRIDRYLKTALPPLDSETRNALKANIVANGFTDPFLVARIADAKDKMPVLIDGHNRDEIRGELIAEGIAFVEPEIKFIDLPNRYDAKLWMLDRQDARRNWTKGQMALRIVSDQKLIIRMRAEAIERKKRKSKSVGANSTLQKEQGKVSALVAKRIGCSETTVKDVIAIHDCAIKEARTEAVAMLDAGTNTKEASAVVRSAQKKVVQEKNIEQARSKYPPTVLNEGEGWENNIVCGAAANRLKEVPDGVASLAFFSPPYPTPHVKYEHPDANYKDYKTWLRDLFAVLKEVARVLKAGGRAVINVDATSDGQDDGTLKHNVRHDVERLAKRAGLTYLDDFAWYKQKTVGSQHSAPWGTYCSPRSPRIRRCHENIILFGKGTSAEHPQFLEGDQDAIDVDDSTFKHATISTWNVDAKGGTLKSADQTQGSFWQDSMEYVPPAKRDGKHPCPFPEKLAEMVIQTWSFRGDVVIDPYNGSGTTTAVAHRLGRRFLGIDIDPEQCRDARARVLASATDPGPNVEQVVAACLPAGEKSGTLAK